MKLSQTFTILKYLGRKHNLAPLSEEEHIRVDLIEAEAMDMRTNWSRLCYYETDFVKYFFKYYNLFYENSLITYLIGHISFIGKSQSRILEKS